MQTTHQILVLIPITDIAVRVFIHSAALVSFLCLFFSALIVTVVTFDRRLCNKTKYDYLWRAVPNAHRIRTPY